MPSARISRRHSLGELDGGHFKVGLIEQPWHVEPCCGVAASLEWDLLILDGRVQRNEPGKFDAPLLIKSDFFLLRIHFELPY